MNEAFALYDTMIVNYRIWKRGGVDKNAAYGRFLNAAQSLAALGEANPFRDKHIVRADRVSKPNERYITRKPAVIEQPAVTQDILVNDDVVETRELPEEPIQDEAVAALFAEDEA